MTDPARATSFCCFENAARRARLLVGLGCLPPDCSVRVAAFLPR